MQAVKQQAAAARRRATWQVGRFGFRGGRWVRWATLLLIPVAYLLTLRIYLLLHPGDATSHVSGGGYHVSLLQLRLNPRGMRALIRGQAGAVANRGAGNGTGGEASASGGKAVLDALMAEGAAVKGKPPSRVAICLVGGAREFHLTAPTLLRYLLPAYPSAHVFLLAPLDHSAHRLSLLAWPRLGEGAGAGGGVGMGGGLEMGIGEGEGEGEGEGPGYSLVQVSVLPDVPVNETRITNRLLEVVEGSEAQTRQGLMQQFKAVELCVTAITRYERAHAIRYDWILRTRVDGYWMGPPPPLAVLDPIAYTIPGGSDWGGLNDRLGMGGRKASWKALRRLSVLRPLVEQGGYSELNAERVYLAQMAFLQVQVARYDFPFCILSRKKGLPAFPVAASLSSTSAALNGAKCRPCRPTVVGGQAAKYILALPERIFGAQPHGIDLCRAEDDWAADWREIFDRDAGAVAAAVRQYSESRTFEECVEDWRHFRQQVDVWDAPPPVSICVRGLLGKFHKMGYPGGDFPVFLDPWVPPREGRRGRKPVVYSVVAGVDYSLDWALMRKLRCRVHAFDSTPEGLRWIGDKIDNLPPASWVHHAWMLGPEDRPLKVHPLDIADHPMEYALEPPPHMDASSLLPPIHVEAMTVEATMKLLNHSIVDILRIGGHVSLHEAIFQAWIHAKRAPPVCQIIISFHHGDKHYGSAETQQELLALRSLGLELGVCIRKDKLYESCVLFSVHHCKYDIT
ncbi:hypothetical protein CLOP_g6229 [Closterium sp. NIES-67]|nr:hypothetical protein CLOP_g6229 [Closterium sp. NIES-67]